MLAYSKPRHGFIASRANHYTSLTACSHLLVLEFMVPPYPLYWERVTKMKVVVTFIMYLDYL